MHGGSGHRPLAASSKHLVKLCCSSLHMASSLILLT